MRYELLIRLLDLLINLMLGVTIGIVIEGDNKLALIFFGIDLALLSYVTILKFVRKKVNKKANQNN